MFWKEDALIKCLLALSLMQGVALILTVLQIVHLPNIKVCYLI